MRVRRAGLFYHLWREVYSIYFTRVSIIYFLRGKPIATSNIENFIMIHITDNSQDAFDL